MISILGIGQSNMAGRGQIDEVAQINNDKCFMLRMGRWQQLSDPVNVDRGVHVGGFFRSGVGPMASFADYLSRKTNQCVGMIPCADGGTKICQWMPGEVLYDNAVFQTKLAMRTSSFAGIIWHQGESDARSINPEEYKENLLFMLSSIRKDLGAECLPIVLGEISEKIGPEWRISLENIKKTNLIIKQCSKELPFSAVVPVNDLSLQADNVHFDAKSQRILGNRYAVKFLEILRS